MKIHKTGLAGLLAFVIAIIFSSAGALAAGTDSLVSIDWLSKNLNKPGIVILDVGAFTHYEKSHIPGAVKAFGPWQTMNDKFVGFMMPKEEDLVQMLRSYGVNNDSYVILYDEGVTALDTCKSARALWTLHALGHDKVAILNGGFAAWEQAEHPMTAEPAFPAAGNFSGKLVKEKVVSLAEVKKLLKSHGVVFLDTRLPDEHFGFEKKSNVERFGHLPGSKLWPADFVTNAGVDLSPSFIKNKADLQQMAQGVGIPADKNAEIITYSNTGLQAAMGYYVLHDLLGYKNVRLFDGSILESAADKDVPMVKDAWGFIKM